MGFGNLNSNFQELDILNLLSFIAQIENIQQDTKSFQEIMLEIQKLHEENQLLLQEIKSLKEVNK